MALCLICSKCFKINYGTDNKREGFACVEGKEDECKQGK